MAHIGDKGNQEGLTDVDSVLGELWRFNTHSQPQSPTIGGVFGCLSQCRPWVGCMVWYQVDLGRMGSDLFPHSQPFHQLF